MVPWVIASVVAVAVLLVADASGRKALAGAAKLAASTCFLGAALSLGALSSGYGQVVLLALALSLVGDACLISSRSTAFLMGLGSFLLAHLAYVSAFWTLGPDLVTTAGAVVVLAGPAWIVWRWLSPHVEAGMHIPVVLYMLAISAMLAVAVGVAASGASVLIPGGALAFYLSDLSVARDRFVQSGFANRLWGLPLYFGAQLLLASTVSS